MTALECAFALLKCSPIGNPENSSKYGRAAHILSEHCQGKEDVSEAAMRIFAERIAELDRELAEAREQLNWLNHLIETIRDKADLRFAGNSGLLAFSDIKSAARRSLEIGGTK